MMCRRELAQVTTTTTSRPNPSAGAGKTYPAFWTPRRRRPGCDEHRGASREGCASERVSAAIVVARYRGEVPTPGRKVRSACQRSRAQSGRVGEKALSAVRRGRLRASTADDCPPGGTRLVAGCDTGAIPRSQAAVTSHRPRTYEHRVGRPTSPLLGAGRSACCVARTFRASSKRCRARCGAVDGAQPARSVRVIVRRSIDNELLVDPAPLKCRSSERERSSNPRPRS